MSSDPARLDSNFTDEPPFAPEAVAIYRNGDILAIPLVTAYVLRRKGITVGKFSREDGQIYLFVDE